MTNNTIKKQTINWDLFESIVVYNALMNETYLATIIDSASPNYFNNSDIKSIFDILATFYKKNSSIPNTTEIKLFLTTEEQKSAFKRVVSSFNNIDKKYNQTELLLNTERFFRERAVQKALLDTAEKYSNNTVEISEVYDVFSKACSISLVDNLGVDYFGDIDSHVDLLTNNETFISTGYSFIDKRIGGGILENGKALYIFSGATNSGKSIMLGNIAANLVPELSEKNKAVVIISMEMSEEVYSKRISSKLSQIPLGNISTKPDELKEFIYDYKQQNNNAKLFIKEYAPKQVTVNHIKAYLQKLKNKKNVEIGAIVVDYVNLIQPTTVTGNSYTDIKLVAEQLRSLAYAFNAPVISATQLNRTGYDTANPGLETTSESMGLSHTADVQMAVWSNENDKDLGILHVGFQKNRYGPNFGSKAFRIDYDTLSVFETDDDVLNNNSDLNSADSSIDSILKDVDLF
jgi:replicative DNA helicase